MTCNIKLKKISIYAPPRKKSSSTVKLNTAGEIHFKTVLLPKLLLVFFAGRNH